MILTIINNIFFAFILHVYNTYLFGKKNTKLWITLCVWSFVVVCFSFQNRINFISPVFNLILFIVPYVVVTYLLYNTSIKKILIYIVYIYVLGILCELISIFIFKFLFHKNINTDNEILPQIVSNIILLVLIRIFFLIKKEQRNDIKLTELIEVALIPIGSIYLIINYCGKTINDLNNYDIISIFIIILINITSYLFYVKLLESIQNAYRSDFLEKKNKDYLEESTRVASLWKEISEFQHNSKYMTELEKIRYDKIVHASGFGYSISQTGCIFFDAIINNKATYAFENDIEFKLKANIPCEADYLSDDVCIILYNILDNAIEANERLSNGRYINLKVETDKKNTNLLRILISNPYEGKRLKDKIGNYITNKQDKNIHGIGLKSIKKIVERHNGIMKITDENNTFTVDIMIFNSITDDK